MACLKCHPWPGNVRELLNVVQRATILADGNEITVDDLPSNLRNAGAVTGPTLLDGDYRTLKEARDAFEKAYIERQLERSDGNVSATARALGIERSHLHRKLKAYGIGDR